MITSHTIQWGAVNGTRQGVTYIFHDSTGEDVSVYKLVPIGFDADADALSMYAQIDAQLSEREIQIARSNVEDGINPDKTAEHNAQEDFDRRVLGFIMTMYDPHILNACLPFWSALQARNGNNAAQRAANLGVSQTEYDECATRMNNVIGASTFLTNDEAAVWEDVKADWN